MNDSLQILEHPGGSTMTIIGPTFPAHIAASQAEVRLVADQTTNAGASTIKLDEQSVQIAEFLVPHLQASFVMGFVSDLNPLQQWPYWLAVIVTLGMSATELTVTLSVIE
jgi:hypothetical protein